MRPARDTTTAGVVAAAGIAPERVGAACTARLRDQERAVYHWILRSFAAGRPAEPSALAGECARHGVSLRRLPRDPRARGPRPRRREWCACDGEAFRGCCQVLNFFASPGNAERYLRRHAGVSGFQISIPQAIESGRLIFGRVLAASL